MVHVEPETRLPTKFTLRNNESCVTSATPGSWLTGQPWESVTLGPSRACNDMPHLKVRGEQKGPSHLPLLSPDSPAIRRCDAHTHGLGPLAGPLMLKCQHAREMPQPHPEVQSGHSIASQENLKKNQFSQLFL